MARLLVLYPQPTDPDTFERRYRDEHGPMVTERMPLLRQFSAGRVVDPPASGGYSHFAELTFDSVDDVRTALDSDEGKRIVAHALEISTGGLMTVLVVEDNAGATD